MKVLVTGAAGFIGMQVAKKLLERGNKVLGLDNLNDYYDVSLKKTRLNELEKYERFSFVKGDISDRNQLVSIFSMFQPERVLHLAAQAGVRYSLVNPYAYGESNLIGFLNILEACRQFKIEHLVFASSSSVYGNLNQLPSNEDQVTNKPISLYAATKASNELMAYSYSYLYNLPITGIRYFTVFGPWGRPDMAPWIFTSKILNNEPIRVFNHGNLIRDFTYIDDVSEATISLINIDNDNFYNIFNLGNSRPEKLMDFIGALEECLGLKANIKYENLQDGDVIGTHADTSKLKSLIGFNPSVSMYEGVRKWVNWYTNYSK